MALNRVSIFLQLPVSKPQVWGGEGPLRSLVQILILLVCARLAKCLAAESSARQISEIEDLGQQHPNVVFRPSVRA